MSDIARSRSMSAINCLVDPSTSRPSIQQVEPARVRQCNADLAAPYQSIIVGHPDRIHQVQSLTMGAQRPVLRFSQRPFFERNSRGETRRNGEVIHMWVQRRDDAIS